MEASFTLIKILFQLALFVLLIIKVRMLTKKHVIPALKNYQLQTDEKRFTLQEQHAILITQKKQLATQFLQQEKQLALLTAKLEKWYLGWQEEQARKKKEFEEREKKIAQNIKEQSKRVSYKRSRRRYTEQAIDKVAEQLGRNPRDPHTQRFFEHTVEKVQTLAPSPKEDHAQTDA